MVIFMQEIMRTICRIKKRKRMGFQIILKIIGIKLIRNKKLINYQIRRKNSQIKNK